MRCWAACVVVLLGGEWAYGSIRVDDGVLATIANTFVYEYATNSKDPDVEFYDLYHVPQSGLVRNQGYEAEAVSRGFDLSSSIVSSFTLAPGEQTLVSASGQGSTYADVANGQDGFYGASQSLFITNLSFYASSPLTVDWQYQASGSPGELGTSDGIDMRIKIREYEDATYHVAKELRVVTRQFFGAGSSSQSFELSPGYYNLIAQGRVLFNQSSASYKDGDSSWSYSYTITQVIPEPSALIIWTLLGTLAITVGWWRRRSKPRGA